MSSSRKVVVIGSGPAGYVCGIRLAQLGQDVTVVERELVGGTCLNVGCIPSKAMITAGNLLEHFGHVEVMGIRAKGVELDLARLVQWKAEIVTKLTGGVAKMLEMNKAKLVRGAAQVLDQRTVRVRGPQGEQQLPFDDLVIATGSVPIELKGFEFGPHVWSSTEALAPERIPAHLVVIGGGYIGLELGTFYRKIGSRVTVLEATPGVLPGQDPDCIKLVARNLKKLGVEVRTATFAKGYEVQDGKCHVRIESGGKPETLVCDQILGTVGRKPYLGDLGLAQLGLAPDAKGFLEVDAERRTHVKNVFAIGDVAGQPMLAHKGSREGLAAAAVIAGKRDAYDVRAVPAVIFTSPEVASVGAQESELKARGVEYRVGKFPFSASGRALTHLETDGFVKILADKQTDEILGVHMAGPEVTELVAEATLAIELGATAEDLARTIHAHPTLAEATMEAAESVHGVAVHIYERR